MVQVTVAHPGPNEPLRVFDYKNKEAALSMIKALVKPTSEELNKFIAGGPKLVSANGEVWVTKMEYAF